MTPTEKKRVEEITERAEDGDTKYLLFLVAELEAQIPKWISVEKRLPEIENHCGVMESDVILSKVGERGTPQVTYIDANSKWHGYWGNTDICNQTYWLPLPQPAAKEER